MAAVPVTISGVLFDKYGRTGEPVTLMGMASITGVGIGGGPIIPPESGSPPGIWGPTDPRPTPPIAFPPGWVGGVPPHPGSPPGIWGGGNEPFPTPPIYIPPAVPPSMKPPEAPEPGSPTTSVPGNWPVQPVTPPEYLVVMYPGIGPVVVAPPENPQAVPAK